MVGEAVMQYLFSIEDISRKGELIASAGDGMLVYYISSPWLK